MRLDPSADAGLLRLLAELEEAGYDFVTPTPATHKRVIARPQMRRAADLRGIFGWSLPFASDLLSAGLFETLLSAGLLEREDGQFRSKVRVSRVRGALFVHSAFPTVGEDAVFLGPDSYRFVDFVRGALAGAGGAQRLVDIGGGAGAGALSVTDLVPGAKLTLLDINPVALRLAGVNARHAGIAVELVEGGSIETVSGPVDLAIANPPYVIDRSNRTYRDGGGMHGGELSLQWTLAAARRLVPGGRMLLYTGVAIVEGRDALRQALAVRLPALGCTLSYREIDPDIFGEELERPEYADVDRIAAVGAAIEKGRQAKAADPEGPPPLVM